MPLYFLIIILEMLFYLFKLRPKLAYSITKAILWNLFNLRETLRKRSFIQKNRNTSDLNIIRNMRIFPIKIYYFYDYVKNSKKERWKYFLISSFILLLINFILPIFKYLSLNTSVYDLGIYLNSLYNISYNKIYSVAFEGHFEPILIPLSFIYEFFNYGLFGVIIILIIQTLSIFSVGIYFLLKKKYQISLIFFLYFPLTYINLFDFHTDSFAIIFFFYF